MSGETIFIATGMLSWTVILLCFNFVMSHFSLYNRDLVD